MGKKYEPVPNELRKSLIDLIHTKGYSIAKAALVTGIYYPTAKAINKVYLRENRTQKKAFRFRLKNIEKNMVVGKSKNFNDKSLANTTIDILRDETDITSRECGIRTLEVNEKSKD
jgi:hypothetical protein